MTISTSAGFGLLQMTSESGNERYANEDAGCHDLDMLTTSLKGN